MNSRPSRAATAFACLLVAACAASRPDVVGDPSVTTVDTPPTPVAAAAPNAAPDAPPAASQVLARYREAIGGSRAVMTHRTIRSIGSMEMPSAGIKGDLVLVQDSTRMAMRIAIPGLGEIVQGATGTTAWATDPMQGPRLLTGQEAAQFLEGAGFDAILKMGASVASAETVGRDSLDGKACWRLKITSASGRVSHECYDIATGLQVGSWTTQATQMGEIPVTTIMRDWRDFGGLMSATELRVQAGGQEQILRVTDVRYDDPQDPTVLDPPANVKALMPAR